jgi:hypothetical protein
MTRQSHCRQRAPVGIVVSSSGTSQLGMFDIQVTRRHYDTKCDDIFPNIKVYFPELCKALSSIPCLFGVCTKIDTPF